MKVKCITNKVTSLPEDISKNYKISYEKFFVSEDKEYIVYAINIYFGYIWYCICQDTYSFYPMWTPSTLFEVSDNRISRYWVFGLKEDYDRKRPFLTFLEWVNDDYFYGELIEGNSNDPNAVIFEKYKELMDMEFPDASISTSAQIGDEEWLICPLCIDAWQSKSFQDALVRCPFCETIFNNPRYSNQ